VVETTDVVDNLIIGSGFAAVAAAKALRDAGRTCEIVDVGYDLDAGRARDAQAMSRLSPGQWSIADTARLFPAPVASAKGVERRYQFGSDFPYRKPSSLHVRMENCAIELSHAIGGFGNVWGAAMLPYSAHTLRNWPVPFGDLERSYENILRYVPLSAEAGNLDTTFPMHSHNTAALRRSGQGEALLRAFQNRQERLRQHGIGFMRSRVAVDATDGATGCRYCGRCLEGCVYGAAFNPGLFWKTQEMARVPQHRGYYALEFEERGDAVILTAVNVRDGSLRRWQARRVYIAAGVFATTKLIARSLRRFDEPIRISDSQYFFFPMLAYRPVRGVSGVSLAEMFVEILNDQVSKDYMHFQVYGGNSIFEQALRTLLPRPLPIGAITRRLYLFQGYLHSDDSGYLELTVAQAGERHDEMTIRGVENPAAMSVAKRAQDLLRRALLGFGVIPPLYIQLVQPGRSFHTGGSFPMGGKHPIFSSDLLGRPANQQRVHIVDSASFPTIGSSTIAFTIMANADRIVRGAMELPHA